MKKILIIGSSGFVGLSLNDYFRKKKNYKIINLSRSQNSNLLDLKKLPKTNYIIYCINSNNIKKSLEYFYHFKKLLCNRFKVKIIFFSSGAVYGPKKIKKKISEKQKISLKKINSFKGYKRKYAIEKFVLEKKFQQIAKLGFKVSIVRGFTFYGQHILRYNYLISQILRAVKDKKKLIIKNRFTYRSFMYSEDMCKSLLKIFAKSSTQCPIYNLGSSNQTNIEYLVNFLNKNYGSNISFNSKKKLVDYYIPSTSKIFKDLKLKKLITIERGIKLLLG